MSQADTTYLDLLRKLHRKALLSNEFRDDRTGTGTVSIFGHQMRFNLAEEFPLLTSKFVHFHSVLYELLWFIKGDTNIKYLLENNVSIWTDWRYKAYVEETTANRNFDKHTLFTRKEFENKLKTNDEFAKRWGSIGKGYGHQWRNFGKSTQTEPVGFYDDKGQLDVKHVPVVSGFDQLSWVINEIKNNPSSRRLLVTGWNPHETTKVDLPPCHTLFQFFVEDGKLSCQLYQRSADVFLGVPFNIASYALLTHLVAYECDLDVGEFVWTGGDVHLYSNHVEQAQLQLCNPRFDAPKLELNINGKSIFELDGSEVKLINYQQAGKIKAPVAV